MSIYNSKTGVIIKEYSINELEHIAKLMRCYSITAIALAGSGHTGGTMSIIDIAVVLYFKVIRHDPKNPDWQDRDRVFWSAGHKAPAIYSALGIAGYFDINRISLLRKFDSGMEGHPNALKLPGIETSSGSLGQGLGIAIGSALNAKLEKKDYRVYCIMGDGELDEGSVWEAAMCASHHKLDNLVGIIDRNGLQIDGPTSIVMEIEPLVAKWESFGWNVYICDGHNIKELINSLK
ncbi:MAG: transketolase, partial [Actinomycetia bacterium]|nr:transketolase [Actinomycetes bacterium]